VKKNIPLLYGFSFFDQFMIVIALWVPYLTTQGIGMRQFMELQAVFAIVILSGEVPSGLLSDLWGRKKTLLESGVPLAWFGVLSAGYGLILGFAGRSASVGAKRYGRRPLLAAVGVLPIVAYFGMASFLGWGGILLGTLGQVGRGLGGVLFLEALNDRISSAFRATVISLSQLGVRASFCLLGPLVGYGIDAWGLPSVLSALGILFSIAFVCLLLPLILRETARTMKEASA
jgi:hypothetical protein